MVGFKEPGGQQADFQMLLPAEGAAAPGGYRLPPDGVRFEEVSLGYPRQWSAARGITSYLRQIL